MENALERRQRTRKRDKIGMRCIEKRKMRQTKYRRGRTGRPGSRCLRTDGGSRAGKEATLGNWDDPGLLAFPKMSGTVAHVAGSFTDLVQSS